MSNAIAPITKVAVLAAALVLAVAVAGGSDDDAHWGVTPADAHWG